MIVVYRVRCVFYRHRGICRCCHHVDIIITIEYIYYIWLLFISSTWREKGEPGRVDTKRQRRDKKTTCYNNITTLTSFFYDSKRYGVTVHILWICNLSIFSPLIVFDGTEGPFVCILLCRPSEDSLHRSAIPDGSPSKDWQSNVGWGCYWIQTEDCSLTIWCHYQWATTAPYEPPLIPCQFSL